MTRTSISIDENIKEWLDEKEGNNSKIIEELLKEQKASETYNRAKLKKRKAELQKKKVDKQTKIKQLREDIDNINEELEQINENLNVDKQDIIKQVKDEIEAKITENYSVQYDEVKPFSSEEVKEIKEEAQVHWTNTQTTRFNKYGNEVEFNQDRTSLSIVDEWKDKENKTDEDWEQLSDEEQTEILFNETDYIGKYDDTTLTSSEEERIEELTREKLEEKL